MPQHRHVIADLIRNPEGQGDTGEQDNTNQFPSPLMAEDQSLSQCLTLGPEGEKLCHSIVPVIADLIRNPEGWRPGIQQAKPTTIIPLSLDGRGIKGEGENNATASSRHCGLDPQSRGEARDTGETSQTNHHYPPLPLDGMREPKPVPVPDTGSRG